MYRINLPCFPNKVGGKDRYVFMCSVDEYEKEHVYMTDDESSKGGKPMPIMSYEEALFSLGHKINFIDNWIQYFEVNYQKIIMIYKRNTSELFKTTPKSLPPKKIMVMKQNS